MVKINYEMYDTVRSVNVSNSLVVDEASIYDLALFFNTSNRSFILNNSNLYFDHLNNRSIHILFIIIYALIFVIGLLGNFIVIYFVLVYKRMQTMTNKFITNLAVSDLLVIFICIPVTASRYVTKEWLFGEFMCRFSSFAQGVSLSVSVMTLTAISIDRYYIIYKPMKARSICTNRKVKLILFATWILSIFIMSPLLIVFKFEKRKIYKSHTEYFEFNMCFESWPEFEAKLCYEVLLICSLFIFPIVFMSYAYINISRTLWFVEKKPEIINRAFIQTVNVVHTVALGENSRDQQNNNNNEFNRSNSSLKLKNFYEKNDFKSNNLYKKRRYANRSDQATAAAAAAGRNYQSIRRDQTWKRDDLNHINRRENGLRDEEMEYSLIDASSIENNLNNMETNTESLSSRKKKFKLKKNKKRREKKQSFSDTRKNVVDNRVNNDRIIPYSTSQLIKSPGNQLAIHKLIRSRRRVVKLLIILVFLFIMSWFPYHFMSLLIDFIFYWEQSEMKIENLTYKQSETISSMFSTHVYPVALCLALANSATNPVCYITLSHGFRNMFKTALKRCIKTR